MPPKKKHKPKPPDLPKGVPKDIADFVDCKGKTLTLGGGKIGWIPKEGLAEYAPEPEVSFEEDKTKKGTFNAKITLGVTFTVPASIKDGKLEVDTSSVPLDQIKKGIDDWVKKLNDWLAANGNKLGGATLKDGKLTVTKEAIAAAPGKAGVKAGPFPHVPGREKVAAAGLLGLSVLFGVGFVNAGDETETRTEKLCPEGTGPGESVRVGIRCERLRASDEVPPPRAEGLAQQIGDVYINLEGGQQFPGLLTPGPGPTLSFELPLYQIGVSHHVELWGAGGNVVDAFDLTVPAVSGPVASITTEQGGVADCVIDHLRRVLNGNSGAACVYMQPAVGATPQPTPAPDGGTTVEPVIRKVETETDGKPLSLAVIPGATVLAGGALYARNTCRGHKGKDNGGGYAETFVDTNVEPPDLPPAEVFPKPGDPSPKPPPDVM